VLDILIIFPPNFFYKRVVLFQLSGAERELREEMISTMSWDENNDEFEIPLTQTTTAFHAALASIDDDNNQRPSKKPKRKTSEGGCEIDNCCSLDFIPSTIGCVSACSVQPLGEEDSVSPSSSTASLSELKTKGNYLRNSIESKLVVSRANALNRADADSDSELDLLMNLCDELEEVDSSVRCPLCEVDISNLTEEQRHLHTNNCLDDVRFTRLTFLPQFHYLVNFVS